MRDIKLDQYYTNDDVVQQCLDMLPLEEYDVIVEPSAGAGAFYAHLPVDKRVGVDLEPGYDGVIEQDYFKFVELAHACQMLPVKDKNYLVAGNPPFGKNASLARRFFNASARFADTIAFVLPRTFRKPSTINQLNEYFHLSKEILLDTNSFHLPDGTKHDVPCVFQVWERYSRPRSKIAVVTECNDFRFIEVAKNGIRTYTLQVKDLRTGKETIIEGVPPEDYERYQTFCSVGITVKKTVKVPSRQDKAKQRRQANVCIRRVGGAAGLFFDDYKIKERDWKSHYYLKTKNQDVTDTLSKIDWNDTSGKYDTAGNPSISKNELIRNYYKTKESLGKDKK